MIFLLAIALIIISIVLFLSVTTTSKAYQYKHTIDPIDQKSELEAKKHEDDKHYT
jgi:cell division protein FtsL